MSSNLKIEEPERRYTDKQFCEMYGIDRTTLYRWRKKGLVRYIKLPTGQIRYLQSHIDEMERKNTKGKKAA